MKIRGYPFASDFATDILANITRKYAAIPVINIMAITSIAKPM
jgi:hypothetical protein